MGKRDKIKEWQLAHSAYKAKIKRLMREAGITSFDLPESPAEAVRQKLIELGQIYQELLAKRAEEASIWVISLLNNVGEAVAQFVFRGSRLKAEEVGRQKSQELPAEKGPYTIRVEPYSSK